MERHEHAVWHALPPDAAAQRLNSPPTGLSAAEAAARLERHGSNRLAPPRRASAWVRFLRQFDNILIYVLIGSAIVTALLGHPVDTAVILGVVLINAVVGFVQEGKAEAALDAIRDMLSLKAVVIRDGHRQEIEAEALVPGDRVLLASGDKVPADLRLLELRNLRVQEAALTGESEPVDKAVAPVDADAPLGDRTGMAYSGTLVTYGQGQGLVVATGQATELGRISTLLEQVGSLSTPLLEQIGRFGHWLTGVILAVAALTGLVGWLRGYHWADMFMAAVGLAVAAIPEGLPAVMTITFAIGVQRMARRNAIVRRLPAVETLGSVTVICSDKTGTLTQNAMTVQSVALADALIAVDGAGYAPDGGFRIGEAALAPHDAPGLTALARAAALCNDAALRHRDGEWLPEGDPTEVALLTLARKAGLPAAQPDWPRLDGIPFESEHRYMATLHATPDGGAVVFVKGAPERLLAMCSHEAGRDGAAPLERARWERHIAELAARGQRVLAVAEKRLPTPPGVLAADTATSGLTLLGLLGIMDPPRPEAIDAVRHCIEAGIRVKMITGDHAATARAIADRLGMGGDGRVLTGAEIEVLSDAELERVVANTDVYARASPEHKLRLVSALQTQGEVVAMTGDGVNDAPALKRADVGVAMGAKGTEAAKEASEVVLADDNFVTIARAVQEGRTIYDNLKKAIVFSLPTNGAQGCVIVAAILFGVALPITPVQVLWVNMVVAVTLALTLAFEPPEADIMRRPPRGRGEALLSGFLAWRVALVSVVQTVGSLGLFLWETAQGGTPEAARTLAVNALVVGQILYLFSSRYIVAPACTVEGFLGNRIALLGVGTLAALQLGFTYLPWMHTLLGTASLPAEDWLLVLGVGLLTFAVVELEKAALRVRLRRERSVGEEDPSEPI